MRSVKRQFQCPPGALLIPGVAGTRSGVPGAQAQTPASSARPHVRTDRVPLTPSGSCTPEQETHTPRGRGGKGVRQTYWPAGPAAPQFVPAAWLGQCALRGCGNEKCRWARVQSAVWRGERSRCAYNLFCGCMHLCVPATNLDRRSCMFGASLRLG